MKLRYIIIAVLSSILFSTASCYKEVSGGEQGEKVTILISTGDRQAQTRGDGVEPTEEGDDPDFRLGTLRVLIYHESNNQLYMKTNMFTPPENPQEIEMLTGRYHFLFIANEDLDPALHTFLQGLPVGSSFAQIIEKKINASAFNSMIMTTGTPKTGEKDTFIPKVALKDNVLVSKREGKTTIVESDGKTIDNSANYWEVPMTQAGIRIDLSLTLTDPQLALYNAGKLTVSFGNVPDHVDLLGKYNYTGTAQTIIPFPALKQGTVIGNTVTWERIVLPETFFFDKAKKENGIVLTVTLDGKDYTATLGYELGDPKDYTIRRGTWLKIPSASIVENIVLGTVTVHEWNLIPGGDVELE